MFLVYIKFCLAECHSYCFVTVVSPVFKNWCVCSVIDDDVLPPKHVAPASDIKKRSPVTRDVGLSSNVVTKEVTPASDIKKRSPMTREVRLSNNVVTKQVLLFKMCHLEAGDMISRCFVFTHTSWLPGFTGALPPSFLRLLTP